MRIILRRTSEDRLHGVTDGEREKGLTEIKCAAPPRKAPRIFGFDYNSIEWRARASVAAAVLLKLGSARERYASAA